MKRGRDPRHVNQDIYSGTAPIGIYLYPLLKIMDQFDGCFKHLGMIPGEGVSDLHEVYEQS